MARPIRTLKGCHMKALLFADMANGGFYQEHRCVEHPRLMRTISRRTRRHDAEVVWYVDNVAVADLDEAIKKLNTKPRQ